MQSGTSRISSRTNPERLLNPDASKSGSAPSEEKPAKKPRRSKKKGDDDEGAGQVGLIEVDCEHRDASAIPLMPALGFLPSLDEKEVTSMQHRHELVPAGPRLTGTTELVVLVVATGAHAGSGDLDAHRRHERRIAIPLIAVGIALVAIDQLNRRREH